MKRALVCLALATACGSKPNDNPTPVPPTKPDSIAATLAIVDVTVVSMVDEKEAPGKEVEHQTILVKDDKIVAVGPTATTIADAGTKTIDGKGMWVIPGLVDMHVHFNDERDGILYLANGVTTVRNMWGNPEVVKWRERAKKHDPTYVGPSIYTAGPIVDGDPPIWPTSRGIKTVAEGIAEVDAQKAAGYDFVKVYSKLPLDVYDAIADEAKAKGIRFAGHMPETVSLAHAIEKGQETIEHLTGYSHEANDDETKLPAIAKQTAAAKLVNVPTLIVMARFSELDHADALRARPENRFVAPALLQAWDPKQDFRAKDKTPADWEKMRAGNGFRKKIVKALVDAGAPIFAGTDTPNPFVVPGFGLHEELALLVEAGLTPYQALRAATAAPGEWLGGDPIGTIAKGARADLVLLTADPLKDIGATTKRAGVVVRGAWTDTAELDKKLEELVASYNVVVDDRLKDKPALVIPEGEVLLHASYRTTMSGTNIGDEELAIVKTKAGGLIYVGRSASEPPGAKHAVVREELDAKGMLVSLTIEEDGSKATATLAGDKLHIDAATKSDKPAKPDELLDANFVATMIPYLERKTAKITTHSLSGSGELNDVVYEFTAQPDKTKPVKFAVTGPFGRAEGTIEIDAKGYPTKITLPIGIGTIEIIRK